MNELAKIMYDSGVLALYSIFTIQTLDWIGFLELVAQQKEKDSSIIFFFWLAEVLILAGLSQTYF